MAQVMPIPSNESNLLFNRKSPGSDETIAIKFRAYFKGLMYRLNARSDSQRHLVLFLLQSGLLSDANILKMLGSEVKTLSRLQHTHGLGTLGYLPETSILASDLGSQPSLRKEGNS